ncbi:MAG: CsbD family protein [Actinomycetota bacterium]|nr:CsbD family protein [Actinomycetota bacterium]
MANMDDAKGRAKEAAGSLTDDDDLKNEGKADRASGKVKDAVDGVKDKVNETLRRD